MRFSKYNIYTEVDKGLIIYNTKNSKYVNIFNEPDLSYIRNLMALEKLPENDNIVRALYLNGYVVDDNVSEYEQAQNIIKSFLEDNKKTLNILLFVTDNCNFRCVYCPQDHKTNVFSEKKWESLYKYLEKNVIEQKLTKFRMTFFGGEPLLRTKQIISFLTKMKNLREKYQELDTRFSMITNGYLLTPDIYDQLTELGLIEFQITLDGFAETHNKTRFLADGSPTWDVIVKNLDYINTKNDGVIIRLRSNINNANIESMENFIRWIDRKYKKEKFKTTFEPVVKVNEKVDDKYVQEFSSFKHVRELNNSSERSIDQDTNSLTILGIACRYAKNDIALASDANLYKCEYIYYDTVKPVGYLDDDGNFLFNEKYHLWTEGFEKDYCKDCIIYPLCGARECMRNNGNRLYSQENCQDKEARIIEIIKEDIRKGLLNK